MEKRRVGRQDEGSGMQITESTVGGVTIAVMQGRLDTATAPQAETRLLGLFGAGTKLVADLAQVTYISSAGLRVLLKAAKQARQEGGGFALAAPQAPVREVLEISGFDKILPIGATREEAVTALA
jgi:anti-sigma B factor antagonist